MKNNLIPIKKAPGFVKNTVSGVIINTNSADYELILEKRKNKKELESVKDEIAKLKEMIWKLSK